MDKLTSCDVCEYKLTTEEIERNITLCPYPNIMRCMFLIFMN